MAGENPIGALQARQAFGTCLDRLRPGPLIAVTSSDKVTIVDLSVDVGRHPQNHVVTVPDDVDGRGFVHAVHELLELCHEKAQELLSPHNHEIVAYAVRLVRARLGRFFTTEYQFHWTPSFR